MVLADLLGKWLNKYRSIFPSVMLISLWGFANQVKWLLKVLWNEVIARDRSLELWMGKSKNTICEPVIRVWLPFVASDPFTALLALWKMLKCWMSTRIAGAPDSKDHNGKPEARRFSGIVIIINDHSKHGQKRHQLPSEERKYTYDIVHSLIYLHMHFLKSGDIYIRYHIYVCVYHKEKRPSVRWNFFSSFFAYLYFLIFLKRTHRNMNNFNSHKNKSQCK